MIMKCILKNIFLSLFLFVIVNCNTQKSLIFEPVVIYQTDNLIITQITENSFQHTSFLQTDSFGKVSCNGLIVKDHQEAIIYDTPTNNESSKELIHWVNQKLKSKINGVISTHFHVDCLGGLSSFHENKIPSYGYKETIQLAKENNQTPPQNDFEYELILKVGTKETITTFFGEGHTKDNVVGYFPSDKLMFGGCLIKEMNANKGNLVDSNVKNWSITVKKIKETYPDVKIIIPGHGAIGGPSLLNYTIELFKIN